MTTPPTDAASTSDPAAASGTVTASDDAAMPDGFARLHADAVAVLTAWTPTDDAQAALRDRYLAHLDAHPDALWRGGPPAHLTVGMLVLDPTGERVLLTHHAKARRWFQLGGHLEDGDTTLAAGALREAREESGLAGLVPLPGVVQLDAHELPGAFGRCREHLDVRFAAVAPADAVPVVSEESLDVAWFGVDDLPNPQLAPLVAAARAALAAR